MIQQSSTKAEFITDFTIEARGFTKHVYESKTAIHVQQTKKKEREGVAYRT